MATTLLMDADATVDPVDEIRLRVWARLHYVPEEERGNLHPVIVDEMQRKDAEQRS